MSSTIYDTTKLDADQVLQHAYDETTQSIRTNATATVLPGSFEVEIDAADGDNISIASADGLRKADVTIANELKVIDSNSLLPGTPTIANITTPMANVEYNYTYPTNTKKIYIKARGGVLKIAYASGQTATNYIYVSKGSSYSIDGVKTSATVYFTSDKVNDTIEIHTWT